MDHAITYVIPYYNGRKYVKKTIDSCLSQKGVDNKVVIIDDCSSLEESDYLRDLVDQYDSSLIFFERNDKNLGPLKTVTRCIEISQTEYICMMSQDDILPPGFSLEMLKCMADDVSLVYCAYDLIDEDEKVILSHTNRVGEFEDNYKEFSYRICINNIVTGPGAIIKRSDFFKCNGYKKNYKLFGEWLLWLKLLRFGKAIYCPNTFICYRRHERNLSSQITSKASFREKRKLHKYYLNCRLYGILTVKQSIIRRVEATLIMIRLFFVELIDDYSRRSK